MLFPSQKGYSAARMIRMILKHCVCLKKLTICNNHGAMVEEALTDQNEIFDVIGKYGSNLDTLHISSQYLNSRIPKGLTGCKSLQQMGWFVCGSVERWDP